MAVRYAESYGIVVCKIVSRARHSTVSLHCVELFVFVFVFCINLERYSKHPHIRTHDFGGQADQVLIYRVLSEKSA